MSIFELGRSDPTKRQPWSIKKNNILVEKFDPLIVWWFQKGIWQIGFRGHYGLHFAWGYEMGEWSRIRQKYFKLGKLLICLQLGECGPYNPVTGIPWSTDRENTPQQSYEVSLE